MLSLYGCYQYHKTVGGDKVDNVEVDAEHGNFVTPAPGESSSNAEKLTNTHGEFNNTRQPAGFWGYFFQIIFQVNCLKWVPEFWDFQLTDYANVSEICILQANLIQWLLVTAQCIFVPVCFYRRKPFDAIACLLSYKR